MESAHKVKVALLGIGTVGGGVYKLLQKQQGQFVYKTGAEIEVKKILVRNAAKERPGIPQDLITDDWESIVSDPEIDIVIELMGGMEPAKTYITQALRAGKQVITANKDLLAECGEELRNLAEDCRCDLMFEAAVAGGIPIIRPLKNSLAGNDIAEIIGIVNGTTNYILTKMSREGCGFEAALNEAQRLGYAEADPTADVEGIDAARKMAIMATIAYHTKVVLSDVYHEGITRITSTDIRYAREFGYVIKLLGLAIRDEDGVEVRVHPTLIPAEHPLASVLDSYNAVFVRGDAVGDTMFYGRGAGEMPTASAVAGDLVDVVRHMLSNSNGHTNMRSYLNLPVKAIGDTKSRFFLRIQAADRPGVLGRMASVLGDHGVSIAQIVQREHQEGGSAELVVITEKVLEKNFHSALDVFEEMDEVREISSVIRVYP